MWKELLGEAFPVIEKAAPVIAQAIGGPYAGAAVVGINLLAKMFHVEPKNISLLAEQILGDPEAENKLSAIQDTFGESITKLFAQHFPAKLSLNLQIEWQNPQNNPLNP